MGSFENQNVCQEIRFAVKALKCTKTFWAQTVMLYYSINFSKFNNFVNASLPPLMTSSKKLQLDHGFNLKYWRVTKT